MGQETGVVHLAGWDLESISAAIQDRYGISVAPKLINALAAVVEKSPQAAVIKPPLAQETLVLMLHLVDVCQKQNPRVKVIAGGALVPLVLSQLGVGVTVLDTDRPISYDAVLSFALIPDNESGRRGLTQLAQQLKPGGRLVFLQGEIVPERNYDTGGWTTRDERRIKLWQVNEAGQIVVAGDYGLA